MKKVILFLFSAFSIVANAQNAEFGVQLNSGLFAFSGTNVERNSSIIRDAHSVYVIGGGTGFGGRNGLNLGAAANVKWVTNFNIFFASELGFDYSKSRIALNAIVVDNTEEKAKGKVNLRFANIYFAPTIGYRFKVKKVNLDLGIGLDLSRLVASDEKMKVKSQETALELSYTRNEFFHLEKGYKFDLRPHANLKVSYDRFGVFCGFSLGTTNYQKGMMGGGTWEATSRLWRMGISYQLK